MLLQHQSLFESKFVILSRTKQISSSRNFFRRTKIRRLIRLSATSEGSRDNEVDLLLMMYEFVCVSVCMRHLSS